MAEALPYICKVKRTLGFDGQVITEESLTVQGKELIECEAVFKTIWSEPNDKV